MSKLFTIVIFILTIVSQVRAQDQYSRGEVFGGYSYASTQVRQYTSRTHTNGWAAGITGNIFKHFGIMADIAGGYGQVWLGDGYSDLRLYEFLFGPQITWRTGRFNASVHALAGMAHFSSSEIPLHPEPGFPAPQPLPGIAETHFAAGLGGAVDVSVNKRVAIRAFQLDYIPVRTHPWTHNVRVQAGLVLRFGFR
ncbi:MAG TPA: hypothetical protein VE398_18080 [Acidobacteriota bacterium]|nr:hypothetical protein [Acidobacteriota bacterium]